MLVAIADDRIGKSQQFVDLALMQGYEVLEKNGVYYVEILTEQVYRAPGTEFKKMPSGTYTFTGDGDEYRFTPLLT